MIRDPRRALDAARSQSTDAATLADLAASEHVFVRVAVALNPITTVETLGTLVPDSFDLEDAFEVAVAVLKNPRTPKEIVAKVAARAQEMSPDRYTSRDCSAFMLLDLLASHTAVSDVILQTWLDASRTPTHVRDRISRRTTDASVLRVLAADPSGAIRKRAQRRQLNDATAESGRKP